MTICLPSLFGRFLLLLTVHRRRRVFQPGVLQRVLFVQLRHPIARPSNFRQVRVDLLPPRPTERVVFERSLTVSGRGVKRRRRDRAGMELYAQHAKRRVVDKCPRRVPQALVVLHAEVAEEIVQQAVRLFELEIKAQSFQEQILVVQNGIAPLPEFFRLLVNHQVGLFQRDPAACDNQLLHFPAVLFHFCREKKRGRGDRVRMDPLPLREIDHAMAHEETVEVHARGAECELWQFQEDADLRDEVGALAAQHVFGLDFHTVQHGRGPV